MILICGMAFMIIQLNLSIAYEKTLEKLKKEDWITTEKLMTYQFEENYRNNSQNHRKIFSKELWT